jgi:hypothetical protein
MEEVQCYCISDNSSSASTDTSRVVHNAGKSELEVLIRMLTESGLKMGSQMSEGEAEARRKAFRYRWK